MPIDRRDTRRGRYGDNRYDDNERILPILLQRRTKFEILDRVLPDMDLVEVNLIFDLRSHIGRFFNTAYSDFSQLVSRGQETILCTEILNTAAHYRRYLYERYGCSSNIIFYYSWDQPTAQVALYPQYNEEYLERHYSDSLAHTVVQKLMESILPLMQMVAIRLPNTYMVNTGDLDMAVLPAYLRQINLPRSSGVRPLPSILLTTQTFLHHYATIPGCAVLTLRQEKSQWITRATLWEAEYGQTKTAWGALSVLPQMPDPTLWTHMAAICGHKERLSVPGWQRWGMTTTLNKFLKAWETGKIDLTVPHGIVVMGEFLSEMTDTWKITPEMLDVYERNYRMFHYQDLAQSVTETQALDIEMQMSQSRMDLDEVYNVNHQHFQAYPISIKNFMYGEKAD